MDLTSLVPAFGGFVEYAIAFVVALSVIVAIHEYGHYIVGRWSGIHAEVFSLGFGPVLVSRIDRRGTRWQIAALPFGGYVKFLGDSNAASAPDGGAMTGLSAAERRHTMHGAPLWARAATVAAGPVFNFILAALIFSGFMLVRGIATETAVVGELPAQSQLAGVLQPGDRILSVNGQATPDLAALATVADALPPAPQVEYRIDRAGQELTVSGPGLQPAVAQQVMPQSAAWDAGIKTGDRITHVNGQPVWTFNQMRDLVGASEGEPLALTLQRGAETVETTLTPRRTDLPKSGGGFETRWLIGLTGGLDFVPELRKPSVLEAAQLGVVSVWNVASTSLSSLWHMITGSISTCNLRGPLGIAESSGAAAQMGAADFIWFIAVLSTAVGLMNLFPIPVLDGGHLVFHAWEAVTGKPPGERALRGLMTVGLMLLAGLMIFGLTNDIRC